MLMLLIRLFLVFLKIGTFTFGGGYAIVAVIQDELVKMSLITEEQILNFIAISEATPGTFAINVAVFCGFSNAGFLGALISMLGLITPSIIIISIIAKIFDAFKKSKAVQNVLKGIRPIVVGVVLGVAVKLFFQTFIPNGVICTDPKKWMLLAILIYYKLTLKKVSPIVLILIAAGFGLLFYFI